MTSTVCCKDIFVHITMKIEKKLSRFWSKRVKFYKNRTNISAPKIIWKKIKIKNKIMGKWCDIYTCCHAVVMHTYMLLRFVPEHAHFICAMKQRIALLYFHLVSCLFWDFSIHYVDHTRPTDTQRPTLVMAVTIPPHSLRHTRLCEVLNRIKSDDPDD